MGGNINKTANNLTENILISLENKIHWARFGF